MSSSSVCQGLQSCVMEPSRAVRLKLAPPPLEWPSLSQSQKSDTYTPTLLPPPNPNTSHEFSDEGGWSFLQSLCNKTEKPEINEKVYVHPTVKRLSCSLSAKSLEMCTESLGCENGSEGNDDISALFSLQSNTNTSSFTAPQSHSNRNCVSKRWNRTRFPPPLSSMSEKGGVQVRPRREHGRLILEAVPAPSRPSFFKAERSNGRLTLRLFSTFHSSYFSHHHQESSSSSIEQEKEEEGEDEIETGEEEEEEEEDNDDDDDDEAEELDENINEDETGIKKLPRLSRCNENGNRNYRNKQLLDWEPFWVAT